MAFVDDNSIPPALANRLMVFDADGRLTFGSPDCVRKMHLGVDVSIAASYPQQWPQFEDVMYTGRGRIGLRLGHGDNALVVDAYPLSDQKADGLVCWLRGPDDRDDMKELNEQFKAIIDASFDGLWICDHQANVIKISKAFERKSGMKAEAFVGRNMRDLVAEGYFDTSVTLEVLDKKRMITRVQVTWDGRRILTTGNPLFGENGEIVMVVCNDRDLGHLERLRDEVMSKTAISARYQDQLIDRQVAQIVQQDIIHRSSVMQQLIEKTILAAKASSNVLITGPSGSGKEKIAELIHHSSARSQGPLIRVNCGAIPENLFESEFFGYDSGAFTGARKEGKAGLVELAHQSTLFLDEVAEIPLLAQVKLLRFLDDGTFYRVGSTKGRRLDVRVVAATNCSLESLVNQGLFRQDLFYRLKVIPLKIAPLKDRQEDIPALVNHFIAQFSQKYNRPTTLSMEAMDAMLAYEFPGNVRELIHLCEQIVVMGAAETIRLEDLPGYIRSASPSKKDVEIPYLEASIKTGSQNWDLKKSINDFEKLLLREALEHFPNQKSLAAALGVDPSTITRKLQKYRLTLLR
jgi:PAS domain S-box-containing protein